MAKDSSFDIVSDYDQQEIVNSVDQVKREIQNRYDFKGTDSSIEFGEDKEELILVADTDYKIDAMIDILQSKMLKRNLSMKILDLSHDKESASGGTVRKKIDLVKGMDQEKAKKITKLIREEYPKVKTQIQGETIRVTSPKKDDLQAVMTLIRGAELNFPVQFENYR